MRSLVLPIYEEMDQDADFLPLGSVMGMAYRDLFHLEFRTGHYYVVLPEAAGGRAASLSGLPARHGRQHQGVPLGAVEVVAADRAAR